jgi:SPP1 family predicted phage head-tail adaptor
MQHDVAERCAAFWQPGGTQSMRAGSLRHKITIQSATLAADTMSAGATESWSTYATTWAEIKPLKGMEAVEHKKLGQETMHRIWIRYQSGITTSMRIVFGSRTFEIRGVRNPDERNIMLEILAEENT